MSEGAILEIEHLHLSVWNRGRPVPVLRDINLRLDHGKILGLVGESGGGKTMVGKAILGVLPNAARIPRGVIRFAGRDLVPMAPDKRRRLVGRSMAMILQNPMTALNPVLRIEDQITDVMCLQMKLGHREAQSRALQMLQAVRIRDPERVARQYPHELSGGMCQRVVIAIAFACEPRLIVADEPTTALDVTVQHQILKLIKQLQARTQTSLLFITHDLGVVAKICDSVSVIFAGRILESGPTEQLFARPEHRYTRALLQAAPRYDRPEMELHPIPAALHEELIGEAADYDRQAHGSV